MKFLKSVWFLIKVGFIGYGVYWLANRPGTIDISWQGWIIETTVGFATACLIILVIITAVVYHWWRRLISLPKIVRKYHKEQQKNRGFQAVTRGLIAVAAGDDITANRQAKKASVLLHDQPLTQLLSAQAALMKGDQSSAKEHFTALLENPEGAFFGLRGLLTNALQRGDTAEALKIARQAHEKEPKRPWIVKILFDLETRATNWQKAHDLLPKAVKLGSFSKKEAHEHEAAILIAESIAAENIGQIDEALKLAKKAYKKRTDFIPAILQIAQLHLKMGKKTLAEKLIKTTWKHIPHPQLADFWAYMRQDHLPLDQVKWAEKLVAVNPDHIESRIALIKAAMKASLWGVARTQLTAALKNAPTKRVYHLFAQLEQKENHDDSQARHWLEKMTEADPDAKWVCQNTGAIFGEWTPLSPADHSFNSLKWQIPRHPIQTSLKAQTPSNQNILPPSVLDAQEF